MADNEGEEKTTRGNEWEVVQLTASTYAAAPVLKEAEQKDEDKVDEYVEDNAETSRALFMSRHFVFPPSQHENLPLEPDNIEILVESEKNTKLTAEEGNISGGKDADDGMLKGLSITEEFSGISVFDDKGNKLPISGSEFEESTRLNYLEDKEKSLYDKATYCSFHDETEIGFSQNLSIPDVTEPLEREIDLPLDVSQPTKEDEWDGSKLPCEAWWKRTAASLYAHAKEANTFWSIFIAAAVTGLVILGQRWQQERLQLLQLKSQANLNNEKSGRMLGPLHKLKDLIIGEHQGGSLIPGSLSSDI